MVSTVTKEKQTYPMLSHNGTYTISGRDFFRKKYNAQVYFTGSGYLVTAESLFNIWQILLTNKQVFVNNLKNCLTNPI